MNQLLMHNAQVVLEYGVELGGVLLRQGRIVQVFKQKLSPTGLGAAESIDLKGGFLAPGMIDIHIHGSAGVDVQNTDHDGLTKLSRFLLSEGVTAYFATFVPTGEHAYREAIDRVEAFPRRKRMRQDAAMILGIHFEGPFVSERKCGALQRQHFRVYDGDPGSLDLFAGDSPDRRLMTLAPETQGGIELTRELTRSGIRVFIGHSQAEPDTLDLAFDAGARHITHFPNALEPLHHRKPGAVAWGLVRGDVTVDCIVDFHHVDSLMLKLMYQAKGADRLALISDAIMPTGLGDGEFTVWGERIAVSGGRTSLAGGPAKGAIAGSVITMREALKNTLSLGVPIHEALKLASLVPARAAGIDRELGSIEEGKRGDLVVFDDDFGVTLAIIGGEIALDRR